MVWLSVVEQPLAVGGLQYVMFGVSFAGCFKTRNNVYGSVVKRKHAQHHDGYWCC